MTESTVPVPPGGPSDPPAGTRCSFCDVASPVFQVAIVLGDREATYRRCPSCAHVWVEAPAWLAAAHADSNAIASLDTGIVERNIWLTDTCTALFRSFLRAGRIVDYGGGTGLFTRMMRDRGFDCRWWDPWCENHFARGFEADPDDVFDAATCSEVVEHSPAPMALLATLAGRAGNILLTTDLIPAETPALGDWSYYAPETGQHVSFLSRRALEVAAERLGLALSSAGNLHVLGPDRIPEWFLRFLCRPSNARRLALWFWKPSRAIADAELLRSKAGA